jgi:hypothetical protein
MLRVLVPKLNSVMWEWGLTMQLLERKEKVLPILLPLNALLQRRE